MIPATRANGLSGRKRPRVEDALVTIEMERNAEKEIAERDAEDERRHQAVDIIPSPTRCASAGRRSCFGVAPTDAGKREQRDDQREKPENPVA
jgi:hypothetical protein